MQGLYYNAVVVNVPLGNYLFTVSCYHEGAQEYSKLISVCIDESELLSSLSHLCGPVSKTRTNTSASVRSVAAGTRRQRNVEICVLLLL